jgi:hypothetical protein
LYILSHGGLPFHIEDRILSDAQGLFSRDMNGYLKSRVVGWSA